MEGKTKEQELMRRHDQAIQCIRSDLERLSDYLMIYQLQGIYLMDPSYGGSPSGSFEGASGAPVPQDIKMINRIIKNDRIVGFIEEYTDLIGMLPPLNRKIIVQWVCHPDTKNRWEKFFWGGYLLNKNQYYDALKASVDLLAIYNPKTDYDALDYINFKKKKKKNDLNVMKEIVSLSHSRDEVWDAEHVLADLPDVYIGALEKAIREEYLTCHEQCLARCGLLILSYWHPFISLSEEALVSRLRKTGHGWQQAYDIAKRQQTTIFRFID